MPGQPRPVFVFERLPRGPRTSRGNAQKSTRRQARAEFPPLNLQARRTGWLAVEQPSANQRPSSAVEEGKAWGKPVGRGEALRLLLASAAIAAAVAVAGCDMDGILSSVNGRHMQPLSERMLDDLESRNMAKESPILVRIFKEESELEVWKVDKTGRFALLRTYPICRWSGDLGPKIQEGDRQAPEGFYTVTPDMMNPKSHYHLAINTGFPNAYDRANERSADRIVADPLLRKFS